MVHSFRFTFGRQKLLLLKLRAIRCGVWFKHLSRLDRALVNLTIKVADQVRSQRLSKALSDIERKLENALENGISRATHKIGFPIARRLGMLAKKWGNPFAENWMSDISFARFLTIMQLNSRRSTP
jgi:hypothetical protein